MWNANERRGQVDPARGRIKRAVEARTANEVQEAQSTADDTVGRVEVAIGDVAREAADAVLHIVLHGK